MDGWPACLLADVVMTLHTTSTTGLMNEEMTDKRIVVVDRTDERMSATHAMCHTGVRRACVKVRPQGKVLGAKKKKNGTRREARGAAQPAPPSCPLPANLVAFLPPLRGTWV